MNDLATTQQNALNQANAFNGESAQLLQQIRTSHVYNEADYTTAGQYLLLIKSRRDAIEQLLGHLLAPLEDYIKRVKALFAPARSAYADADAHVRSEMSGFQNRLNAERAALREQAAREAGGGDAGAFAATMLVAQQPAPQAPGVGTTVVYKYEVLDVNKLPEQYVKREPNKAALHALAKSSKGTAQVEGARFWAETTVTARGFG